MNTQSQNGRLRHVRSLFLLTTVLAVVAGLIGFAPAARADETATQASTLKAADWIKEQWDAGIYGTETGLVADGVIALASADMHPGTMNEMVEVMRAGGAEYVPSQTGALAKVILAADAAGVEDVAHFLGEAEGDLVDRLLQQVEDKYRVYSFGSYLSLITLLRVDADIPADSLDYLMGAMFQSETHGGFGWSANPATGDPDYTALGISALNLLAEKTDDPTRKTEAERRLGLAIDWADDNARTDTNGNKYWATSSSANSTGMMAGALAEAGQNIESAQAYMRSQQAMTTSGAAWSNVPNGTKDDVRATVQAIFTMTGKAYGHTAASPVTPPEPTETPTSVPTVIVTETVTAEPTATVTVTETVTAAPTVTPTVTETVTAPTAKTLPGVCDRPDDGVSVVIDFGALTPEGSDQVVGGCAEGVQADGFDALISAGFALNEGVEGHFGGTVCTINGLPEAGYPECWYVGYWSYWHAEPGSVWEYSQFGAAGRTPEVGTVEGWRWLSLEDLMTPPEAGPSFIPGTDVTAPVITVTQRPAALVTGTSATVDFGVDDLGATLECRLDGAAWAPCPPPSGWDASSYTFTVTGLTAGNHVISIRATDTWGNVAVTEIPFAQGEPVPTPTITETVTAEPTSTPTVTQTVTAEPTSTPTVTETITAEPTSTPTVTETITAEPTSEPFDVYTTVGTHKFNGRTWHTSCEEYSSTVDRCRTEIWASVVTLVDGKFVQSTGWAFNNLTYIGGTREEWAGNSLGEHNAPEGWTADDNRRWYTECDTAATGRGGCRSYIWGTTYGNTSEAGEPVVLGQKTGWTFNNMVRFA